MKHPVDPDRPAALPAVGSLPPRRAAHRDAPRPDPAALASASSPARRTASPSRSGTASRPGTPVDAGAGAVTGAPARDAEATDRTAASPVSFGGEAFFGRVVGGAAVAAAVQAAYLVTRFLLTPLVIARAGYDAYGFWSLLFAVLGVVGVQRMGLVSAAVPLAARALAAGDPARARRLLRTVATLALGLAVGVGTLAIAADRALLELLAVGPELAPAARAALVTTVLATCAALVLGGYQSWLEARQHHAWVRWIDGCAQLGEALLLCLLLWAGMGLGALSAAYAVRLLAPILLLRRAARRAGLEGELLPGALDRRELGAILRLGGAIQGLGALHMAIAALPRLVVAQTLQLGLLGVFEVARKLIDFGAALPARALEPLVAASGAVGAAEDAAAVRREVVRTSTRLVGLLGLLPLGVLVVAADDVARAWIGSVPEHFPLLVATLAPAAWLHLCTGPATAVLRGDARPRVELVYAAGWLVALALAVPAAAGRGLVPAAAAVAAVQAAAGAVLLVLAAEALELPLRALAVDLLRPLAAGLPGLALAAPFVAGPPATDRVDAALRVAAVGLCVALAAGPTGWGIVFGPRERAFVRRRAARLLPSRRRALLPAPPAANPTASTPTASTPAPSIR